MQNDNKILVVYWSGKKKPKTRLGVSTSRLHFMAQRKFSVFLIPNLQKGVKNMQKLKIEFENELDLTLLDNEFFVAMLNQIMLFKKCEVQYGLSKN